MLVYILVLDFKIIYLFLIISASVSGFTGSSNFSKLFNKDSSSDFNVCFNPSVRFAGLAGWRTFWGGVIIGSIVDSSLSNLKVGAFLTGIISGSFTISGSLIIFSGSLIIFSDSSIIFSDLSIIDSSIFSSGNCPSSISVTRSFCSIANFSKSANRSFAFFPKSNSDEVSSGSLFWDSIGSVILSKGSSIGIWFDSLFSEIWDNSLFFCSILIFSDIVSWSFFKLSIIS